MLTKCGRCKWDYPDELLHQMFMATPERPGGYTAPICGICALEMGNEHMGVKRKRFSGEMAEEARLRAIGWRKKHPEKKPK